MERLTKQKMETLKFVGRQRCVRPTHIERRFGINRSTAYRHLRDLTRRGLLDQLDGVSFHGCVFAATRKGLEAANLNLRPGVPDIRNLGHEEAMTEVVCELEFQFVDCLTERELQAYRRTTKDGRYGFEMYDVAKGGYFPHRPDIVCEIPDADRFIAIEVELSPKNVDRWREILRAYYHRIDVDGFIGVLYVADPTARPKRLAELADEAGLGDRFQLRLNSDPNLLDALMAIDRAADCKSTSKRAA